MIKKMKKMMIKKLHEKMPKYMHIRIHKSIHKKMHEKMQSFATSFTNLCMFCYKDYVEEKYLSFYLCQLRKKFLLKVSVVGYYNPPYSAYCT